LRKGVALIVILSFSLISPLMLQSAEAGTTWNEYLPMALGGYYNSLRIDSNGNPCISTYNNNSRDLIYGQLTSSVWSFATIDSTGDVGMYSSLRLDPSGKPCISYYDNTNFNLKFARLTSVGWSIETVDSTGDVGSHCSLVLDSTGNPFISYYDATNKHLKCASKLGSVWTLQTADTATGVGQYTSIDLDSLGRPSISYHDNVLNDLKFAAFSGTTWSVQTVDSGGDLGYYTSIAIDSDGHPLISYYDYTNFDLKYAKWNGTAWSVQRVDSEGYVGGFTSLALDSSGNPCISYYDYSHDSLKYAKLIAGAGWSMQTVTYNGCTFTSLALDSLGNTYIAHHSPNYGSFLFAVGQPAAPNGSILINGGDTFTTSTSETLSATYSAFGTSVTQVRYSNDGIWDTEPWENPSSYKPWSLPAGDGTKTVYYQIKDFEGMVSPTYSDTIFLDTSSPRGGFIINNNANCTNMTSVSLTLSAADDGSGVSQMRFSNDNAIWSGWEPYTTSRSWSLLPGEGTKNVYVQFRDVAGLSVAAFKQIILDITPPFSNAGQDQIALVNTPVTLNGGGSTDSSGIASYSWDFGDNSTAFTIAPNSACNHTYTKTGNYTVRLVVTDFAGNSATNFATLTLINVIPEVPGLAAILIMMTTTIVGIIIFRRKTRIG
jgi:hypothetical protein